MSSSQGHTISLGRTGSIEMVQGMVEDPIKAPTPQTGEIDSIREEAGEVSALQTDFAAKMWQPQQSRNMEESGADMSEEDDVEEGMFEELFGPGSENRMEAAVEPSESHNLPWDERKKRKYQLMNQNEGRNQFQKKRRKDECG